MPLAVQHQPSAHCPFPECVSTASVLLCMYKPFNLQSRAGQAVLKHFLSYSMENSQKSIQQVISLEWLK